MIVKIKRSSTFLLPFHESLNLKNPNPDNRVSIPSNKIKKREQSPGLLSSNYISVYFFA